MTNHQVYSSLPEHVELIIKLLGRKWALVILHTLVHTHANFGELKELIPGISVSVLSDLLSEFVEQGLVEKVNVNSPHPTYFMTDFGTILCDLIDKLDEFGLKVMEIRPNVVKA
jgi:DNA-binding HxlR family transcriptional regulator